MNVDRSFYIFSSTCVIEEKEKKKGDEEESFLTYPEKRNRKMLAEQC